MQTIPVIDSADGRVRAEPHRRSVTVKTDNYTVTASDNEKVFVATDAGDGVIFTLPTPFKGARFQFQKGEGTTDLTLQAPASTKINYGTAAKKYKSVTDADGLPVSIVVFSDGTDYFVESQIGTWANDNT